MNSDELSKSLNETTQKAVASYILLSSQYKKLKGALLKKNNVNKDLEKMDQFKGTQRKKDDVKKQLKNMEQKLSVHASSLTRLESINETYQQKWTF